MSTGQSVADPRPIDVTRELFPKCGICGFSVGLIPSDQLVPLADRNRLAHPGCAQLARAKAQET